MISCRLNGATKAMCCNEESLAVIQCLFGKLFELSVFVLQNWSIFFSWVPMWFHFGDLSVSLFEKMDDKFVTLTLVLINQIIYMLPDFTLNRTKIYFQKHFLLKMFQKITFSHFSTLNDFFWSYSYNSQLLTEVITVVS